MNALQPLLDLLGGNAGWLTTVIAWLGVLAPLAALFGTKFKHWVSDKLNTFAASEDTDDDAYLAALFGKPWYRLIAFLSKFTPFVLPTLADLERAVRLQKEAAIDAGADLPARRNTGPTGSILSLFLAPLLLGALALSHSGCGTLNPAGVYRGDSVLYHSELTINTSYDMIHAFVSWEKDNRVALAAWPEIETAANTMRAGSPQWFKTAHALHDAYELDPSQDNADALAAILRLLRASLNEAAGYMARAAQPPP